MSSGTGGRRSEAPCSWRTSPRPSKTPAIVIRARSPAAAVVRSPRVTSLAVVEGELVPSPKSKTPKRDEHVGTPSTEAETASPVSSASAVNPETTSSCSEAETLCRSGYSPSPHLLSSLQLASGGASPEFVQQATNILKDEAHSLKYLRSTACFGEAMARQGVEMAELETNSRLAEQRKVSLLAAVLQEQSALQNAAPKLLLPAQRLKQKLRRSYSAAVERQNEHRDRRTEVLLARLDLQEAKRSSHDQQALDDKKREQRVKDNDEARAEDAQERAKKREIHRRASYERAVEVKNERVADREAFLAEQEERSNRCVAEHHDSQAAKRQSLMKRFEFVKAAALSANQEKEAKAQEVESRIKEKNARSERHQDECRAQLEAEKLQRFERLQEQEHQVLRVRRMQEYHKAQKQAEFEHDAEIFNECLHLRGDMHNALSFLAANQMAG